MYLKNMLFIYYNNLFNADHFEKLHIPRIDGKVINNLSKLAHKGIKTKI